MICFTLQRFVGIRHAWYCTGTPELNREMPQLLQNICSIIGIFEKYAKKDGDCTSLSKAELKQLILQEFADVIVEPNDSQTIMSMLQLLDTDCDGKVNFEEFTVLVFRVARAFYNKTQECQTPSEGQSRKGEASQQKTQGEQAPGQNSFHQTTQEPQAPREVSGCRPTTEPQKPSQEQKQEPPKSGGQACQTPRQEQDATHQRPQEPSGTGPGHSKIQDQSTKQDPSQVALRFQQDCSQESQTVRDSSHQGTQAHKIPDQVPTREPQISEQRATHQPARECQGQEQGRICQGEVEPRKPGQQQPSRQPAPQEEQCPSQRETQRSQRGQQEVTSTKPRGSQITDQSLSGRRMQEPRDPDQRQGGQAQAQQKPQVGVPEEALNHQRWESLAESNYLAEEKGCLPQGSNQTPACHPEREPHIPQQTPSGRHECGGSVTAEQQLRQQERRPQHQEQTPMRHAEREPQAPQQTTSSRQERGSWTSEQQLCQQECRPQHQEQIPVCHPDGQSHTEDRRPQNPDQTPMRRAEREPRAPQQTTSSRRERGSWTSEQQFHQQEHRPQNQEQIPVCHPDGQSHTQEHRPQNPDQTPMRCAERESHVPQQTTSGHQERGSWASEQQLRQQEGRPQNPDQAPTCRPEREHQVPQQAAAECASSTEGQCRQQQRDSRRPEEPQFCYYESEPLRPEWGASPPDQRASQARESNQSCDPAEVTQDPSDSSARQPQKASWRPASHQKPLQFPSPWQSKK